MKRVRVVFLIIFAFSISISEAQVKVSGDGSSPHPSAGLEIDFTDRGFLPPRMNTSQRDAITSTAAVGLQIFNTDIGCIEFYTGASWYNLCAQDPCITAPGAPSEGAHTVTESTILWRWSAVEGATSYRYSTSNDYFNAARTENTEFLHTGLECGGAYVLYVWAENACGYTGSTLDASTSCAVVFLSTGADQSFTVPAGITSIHVKCWGAGGGAGLPSYNSEATKGGGGGFSSADISVTPEEVLTIMVGEGGWTASGAFTYNYGGGAGPKSTVGGGVGGGRSAIRRGGTELITAGGGGAGSNSDIYTFVDGGAGGGLSGVSIGGGGGSQDGGGGTQSAGGAGSEYNSADSGVQFQGGRGGTSGDAGSSGGGGGWYGGGGSNVGAAGGGSGYIGGEGVSNGVTIAGIESSPLETDDPDYISGIAVGASVGGVGGNGLVVISW